MVDDSSLLDLVRDKSSDQKSEYLAGGTALMSSLFEYGNGKRFLDIANYVPSGISTKDGGVEIGAMATFSSIISSSLVPEAVRKASSFMASSTLRNMATIGGNVALMRDDSFLVPVLSAMGAKAHVLSEKGDEWVSIPEYSKVRGNLLILSFFIPSGNADVAISRRSSHMHSVLNVAYGKDGIAAAVKGTGLVFPGEKAVFSSDMSGSKEYKEYLFKTLSDELLENVKNEN